MNNLHFSDVEELEIYLSSKGIDTSLYGKGKAKTLEHLLKEIKEKEAILSLDAKGKLLRTLEVLKVNISHGDKVLREEKQVFSDGRVRVRDDLNTSLSEKVKPGENEIEAVQRALKEELNIILNHHQVPENKGEGIEIVESPSFPGITTIYKLKTFDILLTPDQFNPDGYIEKQNDKSTYFVWK